MSAAAVVKTRNNPYQKYDGGALLSGTILTTVAMVLEKVIHKTESITKINKGEGVPPDGNIDDTEEAVALNKHNTYSNRYERSYPMGITAMDYSSVAS